MMNKKLFYIFFVTSSNINGQTLNDSLQVIYKNYFDLLKTKDQLDTIVFKVKNFEELLASNNEKIKDLTDAELFSTKQQLEQRTKKIINTTHFVFASNASLNAIKQLDATSDYLTQIANLNNPNNADLGFSLADEISSIIEKDLLKGKTKINGVKKSKFLRFVNNIIKFPVTQSLTSAIPVVSALKSVVSLVIGNALNDKDTGIKEVNTFKQSLSLYLSHYEGLAKAQLEFEQNLGNLDIRKEGLVLLLTQYTKERANTIAPNSISKKDDKLSLTKIINKYYSQEVVQQKIDQIINMHPLAYHTHLTNKKLRYPNYVLNQAKFIRDEIESLSKEYISIFSSYQTSLKNVLLKSKNIGDKNKIEQKIKELDGKLKEVQLTFDDNLNIHKLNTTFKKLIAY